MCDGQRQNEAPVIEIDVTNIVGEVTITVGGQQARIIRRHTPGESTPQTPELEASTREGNTPSSSPTPTFQWPAPAETPTTSTANGNNERGSEAALTYKSKQRSHLKKLEDDRRKSETEQQRRAERARQKQRTNIAETKQKLREVAEIRAAQHERFLERAAHEERAAAEQREKDTLHSWKEEYVIKRTEILRKQGAILKETTRHEETYEKFMAEREQLDIRAQQIIKEEEEARQARIRRYEAIRQERLREEREKLEDMHVREDFQRHLLQQTRQAEKQPANEQNTPTDSQNTPAEEINSPFIGHRWPPAGRRLGAAPRDSGESATATSPPQPQSHGQSNTGTRPKSAPEAQQAHPQQHGSSRSNVAQATKAARGEPHRVPQQTGDRERPPWVLPQNLYDERVRRTKEYFVGYKKRKNRQHSEQDKR